MAKKYTFKKNERLNSKTIIKELIEKGKTIRVFPFRIIWMPVDNETIPVQVQMTVSVPKKSFKKATDRNYIKRRIKESYRLYKPYFTHELKNLNQKIVFIIVYLSDNKLNYEIVNSYLTKQLELLISDLKKNIKQ